MIKKVRKTKIKYYNCDINLYLLNLCLVDSSSEFCSDSSDLDIDVKDTKKILKPIGGVVPKAMNAPIKCRSETPTNADQQKRKVGNSVGESVTSENSNSPTNTPISKRPKVVEPQLNNPAPSSSYSPSFTTALYKE